MAFSDRIRLPILNLMQRRTRLLNLLSEFIEQKHRLITVYAPGGYGKSILLADFAQTTNLPVCWCSLEPIDRDPTTFLTLLAYSIADRFFEIDADGLLRLVELGDTENSIRRIASLLAEVGPHVIVLDDYHKAVSAGLTLAINSLLEQLPPDCTLLVAARGDMTLETEQIIDLLVSERATGLSEEELRFTPEEVQLVLRKRFGRRISIEDAVNLAQATDGNIAQILLTGHVMHTDKILHRLTERLGDDQHVIYQYLADEVFARQPPEIKRFLLGTSILPDMTVELCNALLEIENAQHFFEELVRKDLFIAQVGAGFRYHDLFAEFLRTKLAEDQQFHYLTSVKAANLLQARSRFEDAVDLYISVKAWHETAELLEAQGDYFFNTGRTSTLTTWFAQIPADVVVARPRLLLLNGKMQLNKPEKALDIFERAEVAFRAQQHASGIAEAQVLQSVALRRSGNPTKSLQLAEQGLAQLQKLDAPLHTIAYALRQTALTSWLVGDAEPALEKLRASLELFQRLDDSFSVGLCHHDLGICLEKQGNISGAHHHFRQALKIWETLGNASDLANTLNSLGVSLCSVGQYTEAVEHFQNALDIALQMGAARRAAYIWAGLGDVRLVQGNFEEAQTCYRESTALAKSTGSLALELYNQIKIAECHLRQDDLAEALRLVIQTRGVAGETGLVPEQGLAAALEAQILTRQAEYESAAQFFVDAAHIFDGTDKLELVKTRLWWGYSNLLAAKSFAAFGQLRQAISLALEIGEPVKGLGPTIADVLPLLYHFLPRLDTLPETKNNIQWLLGQHAASDNLDGILQIFAFGTPYLIVTDRPRQFSQRGGDQKIPEFLLYLLLEGRDRGCRWDEVSAVLWPDLEKGRASTRFHQTLRRIRERYFEDQDIILVQDDYYQFNPQIWQWCDAVSFDQLWQQIRFASAKNVLDLYLEIVYLYQGEFIAGFELSDWGETHRTRYETQFLQAASLAANQLLEEQQPERALPVVEKALTHDPYREDMHRAKLKTYAMLGVYDLVVDHYTEMCQTFSAELGLSPDSATSQLYHQLLKNR